MRGQSWSKDIKIFCLANRQMQNNWIWIQNGTLNWGLNDQVYWGFSIPDCQKGWSRWAGACSSLHCSCEGKKLNLCCLVFRNTPLPGRVPLLNLTGIFLFPLRRDLRLLQYSEQLCNVKKGRDCTKWKEKAELVKIKLKGTIVRYIKKCKHDSC